MRPIYIALAVFCTYLSPVFAQESDVATNKINAVLAHLRDIASLEVDFSLEIQDASDKQLAIQKGKAKLKNEHYELQLGDQYIFCDGATMWVYNAMIHEVQVSDYAKENASSFFDIEALLAGKIEKADFASKINGAKTINGKSCTEIEMMPLDKTKPFFKILLWVNAKNDIEKAKIFDKTGMRYIYRTNKLRTNVQLAKNFGRFDASKFEDVEVVDLR